jgi:hypothetical protein
MLPTAVRQASHAHAAQHDARHDAAHMAVAGGGSSRRRLLGGGRIRSPPRRIWVFLARWGRIWGNACCGRARRGRGGEGKGRWIGFDPDTICVGGGGAGGGLGFGGGTPVCVAAGKMMAAAEEVSGGVSVGGWGRGVGSPCRRIWEGWGRRGGARREADLGRRRGRMLLGFGWLPPFIHFNIRRQSLNQG